VCIFRLRGGRQKLYNENAKIDNGFRNSFENSKIGKDKAVKPMFWFPKNEFHDNNCG
jgi:hypothetical protein